MQFAHYKNWNVREVYEFRFYSPSEDSYGSLTISADSEWAALTAFNQIGDLVYMSQKLTRFI